MWTRWFPWRSLVSRIARSAGFLDPIPLLSRLQRLAQPSEVTEPVELLRAGVLFHARGLINAKVIQYNLDWAWPYWVERQYDPGDTAFVPRAFSLTHVNLSHRNWTAVGIPDVDRHPVIDPRGLVTPRYDGWSLDAWLIPDEGEPLVPSRANDVEQNLLLTPDETDEPGLAVETSSRGPAGHLTARVDAVWDEEPSCRIRLRATGRGPGWVALALRPMNPEGVRFIHRVERSGPKCLRVNDEARVRLERAPDRLCMSRYREGDVLHALQRESSGAMHAATRKSVSCDAGIASAAALYRLNDEGTTELSARIPLEPGSDAEPGAEVEEPPAVFRPWRAALEGTARLRAPEEPFTFLYDAAVRSLVLHSPGDVYPGPYTYKRFWFRDAAFIVDALCSLGLVGRARRTLDTYPLRQERSGYFRSQEGEWDSNGAALWALDRYRRLAGERIPEGWITAVREGAEWVADKRLDAGGDEPHAGLLPAGFSAEHLGPNDYYYWDDFWCAGGLRAAARILRDEASDPEAAARYEREAGDLLKAVERSLRQSPGHRRTGGIPASPYRRMDAGAIGSLCAGYPLQLWSADDERLRTTVEHLLDHHMVDGGFFQDMIHSGINAYLTLHLARMLLRAGDPRQETLVRTVADLASSTGQWPEAVHPQTGGGCMGDGQHIWAASDWALMMRSWFVREEADRLILASGIPPAWIRGGETAEFGPTPTPFGPVTVRVRGAGDEATVEWSADWRGEPPELEVQLPGHPTAVPAPEDERVRVPFTTGERMG